MINFLLPDVLIFHTALQICESVFVNATWIAAFTTINFANESERTNLSEKDARHSVSGFFKSLGIICNVAKVKINKATTFFEKNKMFSATALPRKSTVRAHASKILFDLTIATGKLGGIFICH